MTKQNQAVGNDSIAAQAQGDITINQGIPSEQCRELIHSALTAALPMYRAVAAEVANERMLVLENKIAQRISQEPEIKPRALQDPDFQYVVTKAHHAYARRGEEQIADTLVDLIADRAKQVEHTRLSLSLNDAVDRVALLTKNEFAELSLLYILKLTRDVGVSSYDKLVKYLANTISPFVDDISENETSYLYLEAQNCGSIPPMINTNLRQILLSQYGGTMSNGTTKDNLRNHLSEEWQHIIDDTTYVVPCLHDSDKWQLNAVNKEAFFETTGIIKMPEGVATNVWNANEAACWTEEEMLDRLGKKLPKYPRLQQLWKSTPLKSFRLSTIGIAIGHANARRVVGIRADLSTWIA